MSIKITTTGIKAALLAAAGVVGVSGQAAKAEPIVALVATATSENSLALFDSATPILANVVQINGLAAGDSLIGIDYRPTNRQLYGLGKDGNIYTIDTASGSVTSQVALSTALSGTSFGVDFNPVPDLAGNPSFRVVSDTGQNYRINANTGAVIMDGNLPAGLAIGGAAYANNDVDPSTGTRLYYLDSATNSLLTTSNANAPDGATTTIGTLDFSSMDIDVPLVTSFDISGTGAAFVAMDVWNSAAFGAIDLQTGSLTYLGGIGGGSLSVRGIAALPSAVPEPASLVMMGMGVVGLVGASRVARRRGR